MRAGHPGEAGGMTSGPVTHHRHHFLARAIGHTVWLHRFVATIAAGSEGPQREAHQATLWDNSVANVAWGRMSRPPRCRTSPF